MNDPATAQSGPQKKKEIWSSNDFVATGRVFTNGLEKPTGSSFL
jgi:hypothetical protein